MPQHWTSALEVGIQDEVTVLVMTVVVIVMVACTSMPSYLKVISWLSGRFNCFVGKFASAWTIKGDYVYTHSPLSTQFLDMRSTKEKSCFLKELNFYSDSLNDNCNSNNNKDSNINNIHYIHESNHTLVGTGCMRLKLNCFTYFFVVIKTARAT